MACRKCRIRVLENANTHDIITGWTAAGWDGAGSSLHLPGLSWPGWTPGHLPSWPILSCSRWYDNIVELFMLVCVWRFWIRIRNWLASWIRIHTFTIPFYQRFKLLKNKFNIYKKLMIFYGNLPLFNNFFFQWLQKCPGVGSGSDRVHNNWPSRFRITD